MKEQPVIEEHHGANVFVNKTTESIRYEECLCLNCGRLKPGESDNCPIAQAFYDICVKENVALMVTRCPVWLVK